MWPPPSVLLPRIRSFHRRWPPSSVLLLLLHHHLPTLRSFSHAPHPIPPTTFTGISERVEFFATLGFEKREIDRIVQSFPGLLAYGIEGRLSPLFAEFDELGFCKEEVKRAVNRNPRSVLAMEVGEPTRCLNLIRSSKCRKAIKDRLLGKGLLPAAVEVKARVDCLCRHGLIRRDALKIVWVEPRVVLYRMEDVEKKIGFLMNDMGFAIECLVEVPEYLGVNFEKQIVPRWKVVRHLESVKALGFDVGLRQLIKPTRKKFYNMFVKPYPECLDIFEAEKNKQQQQQQQCTSSGLSKLFKPLKKPETEEEIDNMRNFMKFLV